MYKLHKSELLSSPNTPVTHQTKSVGLGVKLVQNQKVLKTQHCEGQNLYALANLNQNAFLMELSPLFLLPRFVLKEYFENTRKLLKNIEEQLPRLQP